MEILKISPKTTKKHILKAAEAIKEGSVLVYPTDTVYGLGCSIDSESSIKKIYAIKNRSPEKPFSVAFSSLYMVKKYTRLRVKDKDFVKKHILEPYTFIVRKNEGVKDIITAGRETIGIRIPNCDVTKRMIELADLPIISTSANISGEQPPRRVQDICPNILNHVDLVVDAGSCKLGTPSKIVNLISNRILRGFVI